MNDRLTTSDWIDQGLRTLASQGPGALKVGPMSTALKVSRGSFYWHFRDIADFRAQLLQAWQARLTDAVIQRVEARPDRLRHLLRRAFSARNPLERAVRAWAAEDADVAAAVSAVDASRIDYIAALLAAAGVGVGPARSRATFLYWAFLGQAQMADAATTSLPPSAMDDISDLFEAG